MLHYIPLYFTQKVTDLGHGADIGPVKSLHVPVLEVALIHTNEQLGL